MLDEKDLDAISGLIDKSFAHHFQAMREGYFDPKFQILSEGHKMLAETLSPKSRVEELEDEVKILKSVVVSLSEKVRALEKAM